jgi:hypothetical protein
MDADMFAFMALFQEIAQTMRTAQRDIRNTELVEQNTALNASADKSEAAAKLRFSAAQKQAMAAMISGGVSIGLACAQMGVAVGGGLQQVKGAKGQAQGTKDLKEMESQLDTDSSPVKTKAHIKHEMAEANVTSKKGEVWSGTAMAIGGINQGLQQLGKGIVDWKTASDDKAASEEEADGKRLEASAKLDDASAQNAQDISQTMQDIIRDIRDKFQSMTQAQVDTIKSIARNV